MKNKLPKIACCLFVVTLLFGSCKKMHKRAREFVVDETFEIVSLKLDGVEKIEDFKRDSCICTTMTFTSVQSITFAMPMENRVYFSNCTNSTFPEPFSSFGSYGIVESTSIKPRKYAFMSFNNYSQTNNACTCGRYGWATYFTITDLDTDESQIKYEVDLTDGHWEVILEKR